MISFPTIPIKLLGWHSIFYQIRMPAVVIGALGFLLSVPAISFAAEDEFTSRVERVLADTPLIDGHNDLPERIRELFKGSLTAIDLMSDTSKLVLTNGATPLATDIPRLRSGRA
jgi:membrane dipeptidase